jgi:hypothetical protein
MEGHWNLTYEPYDGGTDLSPDCDAVPPSAGPASVDITRSGAQLHATLAKISSTGTVADTFDFSIRGTEDSGGDAGNVRQVTLRGYYLAGGHDAGATLQARWITHTESGSKACDAEQKCVGTR